MRSAHENSSNDGYDLTVERITASQGFASYRITVATSVTYLVWNVSSAVGAAPRKKVSFIISIRRTSRGSDSLILVAENASLQIAAVRKASRRKARVVLVLLAISWGSVHRIIIFTGILSCFEN